LVVGVLLWTAHSIPCLLSLDDVPYEQFYGYQTKWKFFLSHRTTSPWGIWLFSPGPEVAEVLPTQQHMKQQQQQRLDAPMSASVLLLPFYMPYSFMASDFDSYYHTNNDNNGFLQNSNSGSKLVAKEERQALLLCNEIVRLPGDLLFNDEEDG
jgi:hypothetical protein